MSNLLRSNLIVASGTLLSRLTGLGRTLAVAYALGGVYVADVYVMANETPNIVYDLLLGGVLSATLVPLFTSYLEPEIKPGDPTVNESISDDANRATNVIITTAALLLVAITIVAVIAAPLIFRIYTFDLPDDVDANLYRDAGTALARIFLLQIFFYGITGVANAYLNSRRRFFAAAWSPVASNIIIIATLISLPDAGTKVFQLTDVLENDRVRWTLGLGTTAGIATMALLVVPAAFNAGLRFRPVLQFDHPAVKKLLALSGWTIGFVAANQVAVVVVRNIAVGLGEGNVAAYFYAFTFFVLPHGLLAVSVATTFQPELARAVNDRDRGRFVEQMSLGVRSIAALTMPAAAAMLALSGPLAGLMSRGRFGPLTLDRTSEALAALAIGLGAFSIYLFVLRGFYAHQDTRTPFVLNVVENLLNIVFAVILARWWGIFGLALGYSLAYIVSAAWSLIVLRNKVPGFSTRAITSSLWRLVLAAVLAAEAMWYVGSRFDSDTGWTGITQLAVAGAVGLAVYVAVLAALRSPEIEAMARVISRRRVDRGEPLAPRPPTTTR